MDEERLTILKAEVDAQVKEIEKYILPKNCSRTQITADVP